MSSRRQVGLVAAGATLLATAPLLTVFASLTWVVDVVLAITAVSAAAIGVRALRGPLWAQLLAMVGALTVLVTLMFGAGTALFALVPTAATVRHFGDLLISAGNDIRDMGIPVPDRLGLLFLTTVGVGGVAVLVDLFAVGLRRPALTGFFLLPLYSIPVMVHVDSVSFLAFMVAASGYLWLLANDNVDRVRRFGRRFTGDGRDVDSWEPSPLAAAGRRLAMVGVLAAVLVPVAIPGMTSGLLDDVGSGAGNGTGGTGVGRGASVNLFALLRDRLNQDKPFEMLQVTTNDPRPYYLRFAVADQISPSGFRARVPSDGQPVNSGLPGPLPPTVGVSQQAFQARVKIVDFQMGLLPLYNSPSRVRGLSNRWLYETTGGQLYSTRESSTGKQYTLDYLRTSYDTRELAKVPMPGRDDPMVRQYTTVPDQQFVTAKVNELTKGLDTEYAQVLALYDFFSPQNNFRYSLSAEAGTSGSDIVDFLTHRAGYCTQYAAALAWMARSAGIPARVAFGFTRGSAVNDTTYSLTNLNLHAWTEIYFDGFGWLPFDATPAVSVVGGLDTPWAPDPNQPQTGDSGSGADANPSAGPGGAGGASAQPRNLDPGGDAGGGPLAAASPTTPAWVWLLVATAALVVLLAALPAVGRLVIRRRRLPRGATRAARDPMRPEPSAGEMTVLRPAAPAAEADRRHAHQAWDELIDTLTDFRIPVDAAETPRATAVRINQRLPLGTAAEQGVDTLARAEERARYARHPLPGDELAGAVRQFQHALRRRVSRRTRLRALLLPRSVLLRWRAGAVDRAGRASALTGRIGEQLTRIATLPRLRPGRPR